MMEEMARKTILRENGGEVTFIYYLTESVPEPRFQTGVQDTRRYGVCVSDEQGVERIAVNDVTSVRDTAIRLVDTLARNDVTPVALYDVVYDWICSETEG